LFDSQDHRGTPEAPGRVVTLIERSYWEKLADHHDSAPDKVWGVAYRIIPEYVAKVKEYLDIREINGYTIHYTPFHPATGIDPALLPQHGPFLTLVYIGTPDNEQFVGPQDPQKLAEHIYRSEGPSGLNRDYLLELEKALDLLSPESGDEHVTDLANRVRAIAARERKRETGIQTDNAILSSQFPVVVSPEQAQQRHHHDFRRGSSIDEQEETEKTS
jgi:cation transport regulator ChaC